MEGRSSVPQTSATGPLTLLGWFVAAVGTLVVWTTLGLFVLMPLENLAPVQAPGHAPVWLVGVGLVFLGFIWPLLLLSVTRRLRTLSRMLSVLYLLSAVAISLGGQLVVFARALDSPLERAPATLLVVAAVALHGWSSKRIEQTAKQ